MRCQALVTAGQSSDWAGADAVVVLATALPEVTEDFASLEPLIAAVTQLPVLQPLVGQVRSNVLRQI